MGFVSTSSASGQGSIALGGIANITEVVAKIVTPATYAVLTGVAPVRRVHKQCWYGLGFTAPGGPIIGEFVVSWGRYLAVEAEDFQRQYGWFAQADTLYWDIWPGGVMYFEVDWP